MALRALPSLDAAIHGPRPNAKPPKREKKARTRIKVKATPKAERDHTEAVRQYVFARERHICRCCRLRPAQSMHELRARSVGGKVSRRNSVAVCGELGNGHECHGLLQAKRITFTAHDPAGAEGTLYFMPMDPRARDWMRLASDTHGLESAVMVQLEAAE